MSFTVSAASDKQLSNWDRFVGLSVNGTLFHTRSFLAYHADRFSSAEFFLVVKKGDDVVGQISILIKKDKELISAISPYGASYGGIVLKRNVSYSEANAIVSSLITWLRCKKVQVCKLTFPLSVCSDFSMDTLTFAFLEQGFKSLNRDVCSVVKLDRTTDGLMSGKTRNVVKTAIKRGVKVRLNCLIQDFWPLMEKTYLRHGVSPTHSRVELEELINSMPDKVRIHIAECDGVAVAGICEFVINPIVNSAFYFCRDSEHEHTQGLSVLIKDALERAREDGFEFYDFGTSTVNMVARPNIFSFKEGFGAVGVFRETLIWQDSIES